MAAHRVTPWFVVPALLLLGACGQDAVPTQDEAPGREEPTGPGRLVIVGGALSAQNAEVYQLIVEARLGSGPLCVLPTASGDPAASMASSQAALARYAGTNEVSGVLLSTEDPSRADAPSVAAELEACSGFYFTGGSQSRIVDVLLPGGDTTAAYRAVRGRWEAGAVLAGSSAGAAMMSGVMIASGSSAGAVRHGVAAEEDGEGVAIRSGMGFFTRGILDQHFLARGRVGRLLVAALATDSLPVGLGIDENTALVVDGDSALVVGASGVVVVDARSARRSGRTRGTGLRVTLLGRGDVVDLVTLAVRRATGKVAVPANAGAVELPADPFAPWAFLHLVSDLAASVDSEASFSVSGATLTVREDDGFTASMEGVEGGVEGVPAGLSAGPFLVDLTGGS